MWCRWTATPSWPFIPPALHTATIYTTYAGSCGVDSSSFWYAYYDEGSSVDVTLFAPVRQQEETISDDLGVSFFVGDDGSKMFASWKARQSFAGDADCAFIDFHDGHPHCAPATVQEAGTDGLFNGTLYSDPNCSFTITADPVDAPFVFHVSKDDGKAFDVVRMRWDPSLVTYYWYVNTPPTGCARSPTGASREIEDVTCQLVGGAPSHAFGGSRLMPRAQALPPLKRITADVCLSALVPDLPFAELNRSTFAQWTDSAYGAPCQLDVASDQTIRCIPRMQLGGYIDYRDSACQTSPLLVMDALQATQWDRSAIFVFQHPIRVTSPPLITLRAATTGAPTARPTDLWTNDQWMGCVPSPLDPRADVAVFEINEITPAMLVQFDRVVE